MMMSSIPSMKVLIYVGQDVTMLIEVNGHHEIARIGVVIHTLVQYFI